MPTRGTNSISWSTFLALLAIGIGLFAVSPKEWHENLGAWNAFLSPIASILILIFLCLYARSVLKQPPPAAVDIEPKCLELLVRERGDVGVPRTLDRVREALDDVNTDGDFRDHIVRVVAITGRVTLEPLSDFVRQYNARGQWEIRVLLVHPDSPHMGSLEDGARSSIQASIERLTAISDRVAHDARNVTIDWRGSFDLPERRGFLIDDRHLFLGHTAWTESDGRKRLDEQNRHIAYTSRDSDLASFMIQSFKSWFDYHWGQARAIDQPVDPGAPNLGPTN